MNWVIDSLIAMIGGALYTFFLTLSSDNYESSSIVSVVLLSTGLWFYFRNLPFSNFLKYTEIWGIISGIVFGLTTYFVSQSVKRVSNAGVPEQLVPLSGLIAYLGGIIILKQKFNWKKFYPMLIILFGSITTILPDQNNFKSNDNLWIFYILLALLFAALSDITAKLSLNKITNSQYQIIALLTAGLSVLLIQLVETKSIGLKKLPKNKIKNKSEIKILDQKPIISIILTIVSMILFREYYGKSIIKADNPGLPRNIINAGFVPLALISRFLEKNSEITLFQYIGMGITLIGLGFSAKNS
jgi:drug/metabolite transporter (DMT)-like permease